MNTKQEKGEISIKNRRKNFTINIRKKQNLKFFRESRRAYVEKQEKNIINQQEENNILCNYICLF